MNILDVMSHQITREQSKRREFDRSKFVFKMSQWDFTGFARACAELGFENPARDYGRKYCDIDVVVDPKRSRHQITLEEKTVEENMSKTLVPHAIVITSLDEVRDSKVSKEDVREAAKFLGISSSSFAARREVFMKRAYLKGVEDGHSVGVDDGARAGNDSARTYRRKNENLTATITSLQNEMTQNRSKHSEKLQDLTLKHRGDMVAENRRSVAIGFVAGVLLTIIVVSMIS